MKIKFDKIDEKELFDKIKNNHFERFVNVDEKDREETIYANSRFRKKLWCIYFPAIICSFSVGCVFIICGRLLHPFIAATGVLLPFVVSFNFIILAVVNKPRFSVNRLKKAITKREYLREKICNTNNLLDMLSLVKEALTAEISSNVYCELFWFLRDLKMFDSYLNMQNYNIYKISNVGDGQYFLHLADDAGNIYKRSIFLNERHEPGVSESSISLEIIETNLTIVSFVWLRSEGEYPSITRKDLD